jgi:selenocysteine-specific elongation factor
VVVAGLGRRGVAVDGEALRRERRVVAPALAPYDAALLARFDGWGLEPPRPRELAAVAGLADAEVQPALNRLLAGKALVKVKPDLFVGATAITALRQRLLAFLDAHGEVTAQQWKELTGTSRKYSIPLAEYFDAEKVTLRVGEIRRRRG